MGRRTRRFVDAVIGITGGQKIDARAHHRFKIDFVSAQLCSADLASWPKDLELLAYLPDDGLVACNRGNLRVLNCPEHDPAMVFSVLLCPEIPFRIEQLAFYSRRINGFGGEVEIEVEL